MGNENIAREHLIQKLQKLNERIIELETTEAELKQVRELLEKERETFFPVFHKAPYGIALIDNDGKFIYINPAFSHITGYTLEDVFAGRDWFHQASPFPNYRQEIISSLKRDVIHKGVEKVFSVVCKNGEIKEVELKPTLLDDGRIVVILSDISERKRAEDKLKESEEKYRTILENIEDGYFEVDIAGNFTFFNDSLCRMLGYSKDEMIGMNNRKYTDQENAKKLYQAFNRVYRTGESIKGFGWEVVAKDGRKLDGEVSVSLIKNSNGKPTGFRGIARDITERKRAEEEYRTILRTAMDGFWITDIQGRFLDVNDAYCQLMGYSRDELLNMRIPDVEAAERPEETGRHIQRIMETGGDRFESRHKRKDGRIIDIEISVTYTKVGKERLFVFLRDISERKRMEQERLNLEEQLRQSQKMEAIGRLAGGIAHDFNNLLTVIKGYSQLSLMEVKEGDPLRENIEEIEKGSQRAADLTRQLLAFGRRQVMNAQVLDLNTLLKDLDKMLCRLIGEDVELLTLLAEDLGKVKVDPGQMEQAIMNLAVNARDAMPSGGRFIIETSNVVLDDAYARAHVGVTAGRYVMISLSDTGVGMTQEIKERVFEPFFTTKEKGKGTGLGLSTVYGIVKQSGGNIWVYSEPALGTTFKIYLPMADEPIEEVREKVTEKKLSRGGETILVVEDEEAVRRLSVQILKGQGYEVLEASCGGDALVLSEEHKKPIHMILTDVVMPGMSGPELAKQLKRLRPKMKVLYMSGYTDNAIVHHGVLDKGTNYVQKPFTVGGLRKRVREVLDKDSRRTV